MATELEDNLRSILNEKTNKIIPENIKAGVSILGVDGTYEGNYTQEDYNTCNNLATSILGETIPYIELEYIESTGTQYIDTGYKAGINTKLVLSTMCTATTTEDIYLQITGGKESYHSDSAIQVSYHTSNDMVCIDYGTEGSYNQQCVPRNTKIDIIVGNNISSVNGNAYTQGGTFSGTCPYSLWIFDCNNAGNNQRYYTGRIYYYKIYENDTLVRDFIPVKNRVNDKVGLYDKVEGRYYYNSGSGEFIVGGVA